jgi:hypothetical protein
MEQSERRARIRANLGIEPINHGQVYTFQIAVPDPEKKDIPQERRQILEDSLTGHKSNLVPLIVRRTEDYSEEEEYEVVYGADWCLVAKELDIEKLWVWVFDMSDEQAAVAKAEMDQLADSTGFVLTERASVSDETPQLKSLLQQFEQSFQKKLDTFNRQLNQVSRTSSSHASASSEPVIAENLVAQLEKIIERKLEPVKRAVDNLSEQLEAIHSKINTHSLESVSGKTRETSYDDMTVPTLRSIAKERQIPRYSSMKKAQLVAALKETDAI